MQQDILCVDIGGTYSRFAHVVYEQEPSAKAPTQGNVRLRSQGSCATASLQNTAHAVHMAEHITGLATSKAHKQVWALAGPIQGAALQGQLTNGNLQLDFSPYAWAQHKKDFFLVNDFALQAYATLAEPVLKQKVLRANTACLASCDKPRAIIGVGTGLGTAVLLPVDDHGWALMPTEAGHTLIPLYGQEERDFAHFALHALQQERLYAEDILSGRGLSLVHKYVYGEDISAAMAAQFMQQHGEASPVLALYARFLGRFCTQWAVNSLSTGGLFLSGGVLMKNPYIVHSAYFTKEFYTCPAAVQAIVQSTPVYLLEHEHVSLWGAAYLAIAGR